MLNLLLPHQLHGKTNLQHEQSNQEQSRPQSACPCRQRCALPQADGEPGKSSATLQLLTPISSPGRAFAPNKSELVNLNLTSSCTLPCPLHDEGSGWQSILRVSTKTPTHKLPQQEPARREIASSVPPRLELRQTCSVAESPIFVQRAIPAQ